MRLPAVVVFLLAAACPMHAEAQEQPREQTRQFAVEGSGRLNCAEFTRVASDKGSAEYQRMIGFTEGYLTAANRYEPNTFDLTPWHNAAAFSLILENHCKANPEDMLVGVVQRMVTGFRPIRVAEFSELLEVGTGENRAYIYETVLRRAQAALQVRGFYAGPEDGRYTPELRQAFVDFQTKAELTPTGVPDPATLWNLLNP